MRVAGAIVAFLIGFESLASTQSAEPRGFAFRLFEQYVESLRQQAGIPGLSAAIVQDGQIVWESGFGYQDLENFIPALPSTPYPVADLTQTFAAVLALRCAERGELSLDEPIRKWSALVPEPGATVRHVLAHASQDKPGSRFKYDAGRYAALTSVIEACNERPYRKRLAVTILDRLGMQDSVPGHDLEREAVGRGMFDSDTLKRYAAVLRRLATPYERRNGKPAKSAYPDKGIDASTGLISTVRDLARFDAALDDRALLRSGTQALAWTNAVATDGSTLPSGLGWFVQTYRQERIIWHFGVWPGAFSSLFLKVPDRSLTLILLANSDGLSAPFPLASGDVTTSLFARVFLRLFV